MSFYILIQIDEQLFFLSVQRSRVLPFWKEDIWKISQERENIQKIRSLQLGQNESNFATEAREGYLRAGYSRKFLKVLHSDIS